MEVTQGHGNPDWSRDETLLALDLYLSLGGSVPGPNDQRVIDLAGLLGRLPIHAEKSKRETFRNPAGVAFKLQNLRSVATGVGLKNVSNMDRETWASYGTRAMEVAALAKQIRQLAARPLVSAEEVDATPEDMVFSEGRILSARHYSRERKARHHLLRVRNAAGHLMCDACDRTVETEDVRLSEAAFEAHHERPLAEGVRDTKLADLKLLCATCHRMLHRAIQIRGQWMSVADFRTLLAG